MKAATFVISIVVLFSLPCLAQKRSLVYFLTGGPFDVQTEIEPSLKTLSYFMQVNFSTTKFAIVHNSKWAEVCSDIKTEANTHASTTVILSGHSYGAQAAMTIADCVSKAGIRVDAIIAIDPVQKPFDRPVDVVPPNVVRALNFYQDQDPFITGNANLHREGNGHTRVSNDHVMIKLSGSPHQEIVNTLVNEELIQKLITRYLARALHLSPL